MNRIIFICVYLCLSADPALGAAAQPQAKNHMVAAAHPAAVEAGLPMAEAIALPNFGSRNGPTEIERGSALEALAPALQAMGHEVRAIEMRSGLHGIRRVPGGWQGGADPRREGVAQGR